MTELQLPPRIVDAVMVHALRRPDQEVCGLVGARGGIPTRCYPVDNVAERPESRFRMDPRQQIAVFRNMRERGEALFAIYHSHPRSPAEPSPTDVREAAYAEAFYLIVSTLDRERPCLRAFRRVGAGFVPIKWRSGPEPQSG